MSQTRILVTGAAGFIGSAVLATLISEKFDSIGIDSFSNYYSPELKKLRVANLLGKSRDLVQEIDISNYRNLKSFIENFKPNIVIHLAAQPGVRLPIDEVDRYVESNVIGYTNVLRVCVETGVGQVLYASSSSVYGDISPLPYREDSLLLSPKSFYGGTKLLNEIAARTITNASNISTRGLRFFTVYGPWGRPDMAYFRLMAAALGKSNFTLFGDGNVKRDFTFVSDVAQTTIKLMKELQNRPGGFHDIVNLGGQRPLSMNYLISQIEKLFGSKLPYSRTESNSNDSLETAADNSYLQSLVPDLEFTKLEDGISIFANWMIDPEISSEVASWINSSK